MAVAPSPVRFPAPLGAAVADPTAAPAFAGWRGEELQGYAATASSSISSGAWSEGL